MDVLNRNRVPFGVIGIVSVPIADNIDHVLEFFESENIFNLQLNFLHNSGRARSEDCLGADRMFRVHKVILDHMLANPSNQLVESHMKRRVLEFAGHRNKRGRTSSCHQRICSAGIEFVAVTAQGRIFPCGTGMYPKYELGTVSGKRRPDKAIFFRRFFPMELYKHCGSCPARVMCDYGCMAVHDQDLHHFIDGCMATKRLYAYMEFRRDEVGALAQRFISRTHQTKYVGRSRDLDRVIALRRKLFDYMELTGQIVCTVSKEESDIQVRANNQTKALTSFGAAHLMETMDRC